MKMDDCITKWIDSHVVSIFPLWCAESGGIGEVAMATKPCSSS